MGYFNGWSNYKEFAEASGKVVKCSSCGEDFTPPGPRSKHCPYEENPTCFNERELANMSRKKWVESHGMTVEEFVSEHGIDTYNSL